MAQGSLTLLQEEAYYKVLKAFAAGSYDLVGVSSTTNGMTVPNTRLEAFKYW